MERFPTASYDKLFFDLLVTDPGPAVWRALGNHHERSPERWWRPAQHPPYIVAMQTLIETPAYLSDAKALGLKDAARTVRA